MCWPARSSRRPWRGVRRSFQPDYRAILSAGEAGGVTGQVLKQIAEFLTRRLEIRGKITSALVYPIILVLMSLVSVAVIVFVLIPSISPIFIGCRSSASGHPEYFRRYPGQLAQRRRGAWCLPWIAVVCALAQEQAE